MRYSEIINENITPQHIHSLADNGDGGGESRMAEGKVKLSTDPNYYGATIDDAGFDSLPIVNIPANRLVGFEPDDKMNQSKSVENVKKIMTGLKKGDKLPPLLVREYKQGYQVLDGHHRFWAYKQAGVKSIPVRIVPAEDIEEIGKQGVAENFADGRVKGKSRPGRVKRAGASCDGSVSSLRAKAKKYGGEKGKMYHWCANMKGGRSKANEAVPTGLEFKGYPCTKDCSGHQAGHDWAERWGIEDPGSCPYSNNSFWEGCLARTDDFQDE